MKYIIILGDGMADEPLPELNGKTPLEAVDTPAMDSIARSGVNGTFLTLPEGLPTSSDVANMSVLGFYPERNYPGRGPIEAVSQGIELGPDDVAFRCNLVYASEDGVLRDYSAGHIDNTVSAQLMRDLQAKFGSDKVTFYPGVSYRNLLVLHGREFSDKIDYFKPDSSQDIPLAELKLSAADGSPEAAHTVAFLDELDRKCAEFLAAHALNQGKEAPANRIWPWSPGRRPNLTPFDDTNYAGKVAAALEAIKTHDLVYVHVEAIDECSHLGDLKLKMQAIADFDAKIVAPILEALKGLSVRFAVLPDHPVPIRLRKHTTTPVPLAVCGPGIEPDGVQAFSETLAPTGKLGFLKGNELVKKLLAL